MSDEADQPTVEPVLWRRSNDIYDKFTQDSESEVLGLIAYGLYKREKRQWMDTFCQEKNRRPNEDDLRDFYRTWTPAHIEFVKNSASSVLAEFAQDVIDKEEPEILRAALAGGFWRSVFSSLSANGIYTLILILLSVILVLSGVDLTNLFQKIKG